MSDIYLRVEAVNLANCVYDTNDISTIRGSSYMLLDTVNNLSSSLRFLEKISAGASTGLFRVKSGLSLEDAKVEVRKALYRLTGNHATFTVSALEGKDSSFKEIQETLIAGNRWAQFQTLTLPWGTGWSGADFPCALDGVRPAIIEDEKFPEGRTKKVSASVSFRREKGRELRNGIYSRILNCPESRLPSFTNNLEELSEDPGQGNLNGKIAFIYVDGNKFGSIRERFCDSEEDLMHFDKTVQMDFRAKVLEDLIAFLRQNRHGITSEGKLRLETLLWGGDEIEWVVPAWMGWLVLRLFYGREPKPTFETGTSGISYPLTHAAGVVFCHHNAPILQIRQIAHSLCDLAKGSISDIPKARESADLIRYLVLESFDMIEGGIDVFLKNFYTPIDPADLTIRATELVPISKHLEVIRCFFPRKKVFEIIKALQSGGDFSAIQSEGISDCPNSRKAQLSEAIEEILSGNPRRWFLIADLWDYAVFDSIGVALTSEPIRTE